MLELQNVKHKYNGRVVLDVPLLQIDEGEIVGLVGPNGSGKSTMLKLMSFIEKPAQGTILMAGLPEEPFSKRVRFRVSLLPQETYLLKRSVSDNIAYGLSLRKGLNIDIDAVVANVLDLVGLPNSFGRRYWNELSGGEAQRVALAARLALRPDCLMLDEPTASVDLHSVEKIRQAVLQANRDWRMTLVIASHDQVWLDNICDRNVFLFNGCILSDGLVNIMFGPWKKMDDGTYIRKFSDGQVLNIGKRSGEESVCILTPDVIKLQNLKEETNTTNYIRGQIIALAIEPSTDKFRIQVKCGEQFFNVRVSKTELENNSWLPGRNVKLFFSVKDIIWR